MNNKPISEEPIHEFTEALDDSVPTYSEEDGNIIMPNGGTTREYVLTKDEVTNYSPDQVKTSFNPTPDEYQF